MIQLYKTGVIVVLLLFFSYSYAASTPDELAKLLIQAIEESDLEKYESLIYPASLKLQKERSMEMYKKQMRLRFNRKKPSQYNSYKVNITDIVNDKDTDLSKRMLRFYENKWAIFPVTPEKRLNITTTDGDIKKGQWTVPYSSQVLAREKGKWYVIYPSEIKEVE